MVVGAVAGGAATCLEKLRAVCAIAGWGGSGHCIGRLTKQIVKQCLRRFFAFALGEAGEQVWHERARFGFVRRCEPSLQPSGARAVDEQNWGGTRLRVVFVAVDATGVGDLELGWYA